MSELGRTSGAVTIGGRLVPYSASVELVEVRSDDGQLLGDASVISYVRDEAGPTSRPVLVVFNGGPGAASISLHLSGLGPWTAEVPTDLDHAMAGPFERTESTTSILDVTDLLFIDPVGAGYGRIADEADTSLVYSLQSDANYFADIVTNWLRSRGRPGSPVFLLGESYGTLRAPALAEALSRRGLFLGVRGIALLGQAVNVQDTLERPTNVSSIISKLPTFAAIGHYHGLVKTDDVEELMATAWDYGITTVAPALLRASHLSESEVRHLSEELEGLTGLAAEHWVRYGLRITAADFRKELLRETGRILGAYDARYTAHSWDRPRGDLPIDPSFGAALTSYAIPTQSLLSEEFQVDTDRDYRILDMKACPAWNWEQASSTRSVIETQPGSPFQIYDYAGCLSALLRGNSAARLFIGTGIYDTLTTVGAVNLLLATNDFPAEQTDVRRYGAGHMMYSDPSAREKCGNDLRDFISTTLGDD